MKKIAIVIANYNGYSLLAVLLPQLKIQIEKQNYYKVEIVICDDASQDQSLAYVPQIFPTAKVFINSVNQGYGGNNNQIVGQLDHDWLLLLNTDCTLADDFWQRLNELESTIPPNCFSISPYFTNPLSGEVQDQAKMGQLVRGRVRVHQNFATQQKFCSTFYGVGAALLVQRKLFDQLGGFDELMSPFYFEDVDLCYRAQKRGFVCIYCPELKAYHSPGTTIKSRNKINLITKISNRNAFIFMLKNIHDPYLYGQYWFFTFFNLFFKLITFRWNYLNSWLMAIKLWPQIALKRELEKKESIISDRQIFRQFESILPK